MVAGDEPAEVAGGQASEIQRLKKRVEMLDQRLDNIDSMVSAVAERIMSQLATLNLTCPHCGKDFGIALIGVPKLKR